MKWLLTLDMKNSLFSSGIFFCHFKAFVLQLLRKLLDPNASGCKAHTEGLFPESSQVDSPEKKTETTPNYL